ncbi:MAG: hypothetical protein ACTSPY_17800 [Candidatus Helarchaeota archaeon]
MSNVNVIKNYFCSARIIPGLVISFILALPLELIHFLMMLVAGAFAGILIKKGWISFVIGFIGISLAWGVYFIIFSVIGPLDLLLSIIGSLIGIPGFLLIIIAILIGGLLGGFGAMIGGFIMQMVLGEDFNPKEKIKWL